MQKFHNINEFNANLLTAMQIANNYLKCKQREAYAEEYKMMRKFVRHYTYLQLCENFAELNLKEISEILKHSLRIEDVTLTNVKEHIQKFANEYCDSITDIYLDILVGYPYELTNSSLRAILTQNFVNR